MLTAVAVLGVGVSVLAQEREIWSATLEVGHFATDDGHEFFGYYDWPAFPEAPRYGRLSKTDFEFRGVQFQIGGVVSAPTYQPPPGAITIFFEGVAPPFPGASEPGNAEVYFVVDGRRLPVHRAQLFGEGGVGGQWLTWYLAFQGGGIDWTAGQSVRLSLVEEVGAVPTLPVVGLVGLVGLLLGGGLRRIRQRLR